MMKRSLLFVLTFYVFAISSKGQISITSSIPYYTQDFNGLANSTSSNTWTNNSTLAGWYSNKTSYSAVNSGTASTLYSFGTTSADRALGQITGQNNNERVFFGIRLKNTTGSSVDKILVSYTGEQWYNASQNASTLNFGYLTGASVTSLTTGTYTDPGPGTFNFVSLANNNSAGTLDGNSSTNRKIITAVIQLGTPLANNSEIMLRWSIPNGNQNGVGRQGLGIDDLLVSFGLNNNFRIPNGTIFNDFNVNGFDVTLDGTLNITGALTLTQGIVNTTNNNVLIFNDGATAPGVSNASYVNGPVRKIGNDVFIFPVGKNGKYVPIAISAPGNVGDAFTAEYIPSSGAALGPITSPGLLKVSGCEYWNLERISGNSNVNVTLYWDEDNACTGISDPPSIVVAHFDGVGGSWNSHGGIGAAITTNSGSVTWNNVSQFSPFTLGSTTTFNVLPVHFSNVKVAEKQAGVQVGFTNLTESDIDHYDIERSINSQSFSVIQRIKPEKNNYGVASYTYLDASAFEGKNAYRIKAVETTGKIIYSDIVNITLGVRNRGLSVYAKGGQAHVQIYNLPAGKYQFKVFSSVGQLISVESINHTGGSLSQITSLKSVMAGVYLYYVSGPVEMQKRFVVR
ncbi:hypothetical protein OCK74_10040 [Chitinophagaceae bacterium LB-8]|uniref:T9SS type A sorting domain-containing protein n=1 Tax=Paraflavisolibacter caeni TaxID=2982496 RepID=A0A9X3B8A7_9BACT|nr:hypothetical protein [Paraflavisolibacter caeni]MCU7549456.1 hypothetical protein [Paraflavisolibacter caeni]